MKQAFIKALKNFISILPMLFAVILLVGLLQTYVTPDMLKQLFGFHSLSDLFTGTFIGSISSGNPIMSYIISDELLQSGISLYATSAFILSWVTLGIIQLPAEVSLFGMRFTFYKNILTLLSTILVAFFTVITLGIFV